MKFLIYSDIHHHSWTTGITLEDTLFVEKQTTDFSLENKLDFILFCGDRFESRNPHAEVQVKADALIKERNDLGIVSFMLTGNHDQWFKRQNSGHSFANIQVFGDSLPNVVVMDEPKTYRHDRVSGVLFHALPAGNQFDMSAYQIDERKLNFLVIHDLLKGTKLDGNGYQTKHGIDPDEIDHMCFDFVFGGDAHFPQKMSLKYTNGGYIGAALQHTRRDRGSSRGWAVMDVEKGRKAVTEFYESDSPRFLDVELELPLTMEEIIWKCEMAVAEDYDDGLQGNILTLFLKGKSEDLSMITDEWKENLCKEIRARRVSIIKNPIGSTVQWKIGHSKDGSVEGDLINYINSGMVDMNGLGSGKLIEKFRGL